MANASDQPAGRPELLREGILDKEFPWLFNSWYFRLRLDEEIERCKRYGLLLAVLVLELDEDNLPVQEAARTALALKLYSSVRSFDTPSVLDRNEFAFCLVHCGHWEAERVNERLSNNCRELGYSVRTGIAIYSDEATSASALVEQARADLRN